MLVWYNTAGTFTSHWVTAVGTVGSGADERVIVMSWGALLQHPDEQVRRRLAQRVRHASALDRVHSSCEAHVDADGLALKYRGEQFERF